MSENNRVYARNLEDFFSTVYRNNSFGGVDSKSGPGSSLAATKNIQFYLPQLIKILKIKKIVDVPCGDFNWMQYVIKRIDVMYYGYDIVDELITKNKSLFEQKKVEFHKLDATVDIPIKADLIFCRDLLVHLDYLEIKNFLLNAISSGSKYLAVTNFPISGENFDRNSDFEGVFWRPLNLEASPFNFPPPKFRIHEDSQELQGAFSDKEIAFWKLRELKSTVKQYDS